VKLLRESRVHDHETEDGLPGLISVVGVKYTTARHTAEKAVDLICQKMQRPIKTSQTGEKPVHGGNMTDLTHFLAQAQAEKPVWLSDESLKHLIQTYGTNYEDVLAYRSENPVWGRTVSSKTPVLMAEIIHAVRSEMAQKLRDVIQRRTKLGSVGLPDVATILRTADLMMSELNWTPQQRFKEIQHLYDAYGESLPEEIQPTQSIPSNGKGRYEELFLPKPALLAS
jgi:glycerol-3-phosphate dehydrogenase